MAETSTRTRARCLDLADRDARDPAVAGAKAAGLARAREAGLPVLPGVVVPAAESHPVAEVVIPALGLGGGKARLAAMQVRPDDGLLAELRARLPGDPPFIVRSSSPLEADGTWSGAFSSFHGVTVADLGAAVRGCWGSAFSVGVLDRAERTGTPVERLELAVLVQPELLPELGGIARLGADGTVRVTATDGPLRPLMAGHVEGHVATVDADGRVHSAALTDHPTLRRVAALCRETEKALGHQLIEWAYADGSVTLLQSIRSPVPAASGTTRRDTADDALRSPAALRIARLAQRFSGPLADELVLPWAVAAAAVPEPVPDGGEDPVAAFAEARSLASQLVTTLWGGSPRAAAAEARRVLRQLRSGDAGPALAAVEALAGPGPQQAAAVAGRLRVVHDALIRRRLVDSSSSFWRLSPEQVAEALTGAAQPAASRLGVDHWEPYVHGVVLATGTHHTGTPAAPGAGAGRVVLWRGHDATAPDGRYVLVASEPGPSLAPLLWNAAGLVTRAGSTAAHLIEFAHSIGVPTVVGCELPAIAPDGTTLVAVDGDRGVVALSPPG